MLGTWEITAGWEALDTGSDEERACGFWIYWIDSSRIRSPVAAKIALNTSVA